MSIRDQLDQFRSQLPACNVVAYADLSTGMILCSSTRAKVPQEQLDLLCQTATDLLTGDMALQVAAAVTNGPDQIMQTALVFDGPNVEMFLRLSSHPTEALCCDCSTDIDLQDLGRSARALLLAMAAAS